MGQGVLLWTVLAALCFAPTPLALEQCPPLSGATQTIQQNCQWKEAAGTGAVTLLGPPAGVDSIPPVIAVGSTAATAPGKVTPGFTLSVQRVIFERVDVGPPTAPGGLPVLLPLGLFSTAPSSLSMVDVRLVVPQDSFKAYLQFFSKELDATQLTAETGSITMYTDSKSFVFIPSWSNANTELLSVTIASGPCLRPEGHVKRGDIWRPGPGCNVMAADNTTLVPILMRNASIATAEPLLMRITSNVTLGPGLKGSIPIRRPVILLGLASVVTSIDFGMVVNQLNVTPPFGTLLWQGLVLVNLAPGDSRSSLIAAPYSTTTSTNMWPIYCNRSAALCVRMNNVTMVIPTEREVNYHIFMYTMHNSPAPSLRALASFMRTDLGFKQLEFMPGPGNDTMTIKRLLSRSWQFKNVVTTTKTFVAPKLPPPTRPFVLSKSGPAPLVQAIKDCSTFNAAMNYNSSRVFVWRLLRNASIGDDGKRTCAFQSGYVGAPTHLFGQVLTDYSSQQAVPANEGSGSVVGLDPATSVADPEAIPSVSGRPPGDGVYSLSFGYVPTLFELPADAQDKFMQIQNVTLAQLPQLHEGSSGIGRLLRQVPGSATPPGIWTILLWPWRRSSNASPLFVADAQLILPEPEWSLLAQVARGDDSFAMQLQGPIGLTFTGVTVLEDQEVIRVGSLQGPGITGSNLWLLKDPIPASDIPGYTWPASLAAAAVQSNSSFNRAGAQQQGGQSGLSTAAQAAVGVCVAVVGALAIALGGLFMWRHRRRRQGTQPELLPKSGPPSADSSILGDVAVDACGRRSPDSKTAAGRSVASVRDASLVADISARQSSRAAAKSTARTGVVDRRSTDGSSAAAASDCLAGSKAATGTSADTQSGSGGSSVEHSIAQGLQRWSAAVSATTMQLMKRRLEVNNASALFPGSSACGSNSGRIPAVSSMQVPAGAFTGTCTDGQSTDSPAGASRIGSDGGPPLHLQQVIGTGSFGSVYLASWRGKQVAVKVMHLPADALTEPLDQQQALAEEEEDESDDSIDATDSVALDARQQQQQQLRQRRQWQRQQNSPPHMAIMEAVVSSTMSHPNVVQVYTYMLTPLMARNDVPSSQQRSSIELQTQQASAWQQQQEQQEQEVQEQRDEDASHKADKGVMSGWQLRLIMEYCDQGTLREALDRKRLPRISGTTYIQPLVVLSLSHDIAAALLHLHSEGIVHGDLKAGNVLLTAGSITSPGQRGGSEEEEQRAAEVWAQAGSLPLTAKVADFGLAMPLGPSDTHATMLARGTPSHMSPELFMAGHVSKASDVYAFGIMLYEIITGRRAYASVPIPLLPHEVAMRGLRPEWPQQLPPECAGIQRLAEACWAQEPQSRPTFADILAALEQSCMQHSVTASAAAAAGPACSAVPCAAQQAAGTSAALGVPPVAVVRHPQPQTAQPQAQPHQQQQRQQIRIKLPGGLRGSEMPPQVDLQPGRQLQQQQQQVQLSPKQPISRSSAQHGAGLVTEPSNKNAMDWSEVSYGNSNSKA